MKIAHFALLFFVSGLSLFAQLEKVEILKKASTNPSLGIEGGLGEYIVLTSNDLSNWNLLRAVSITEDERGIVSDLGESSGPSFYWVFPKTITVIGVNEDPSVQEAMLIETENEAVIVCGEKNEAGKVIQINQIIHSYDGTDEGSAFIDLNSEGLPARLFSNGIEIAFHGWVNNRVSISIIGEESEFVREVEVDERVVTRLRNLRTPAILDQKDKGGANPKKLSAPGALALTAHLTITVVRAALAVAALTNPVGWVATTVAVVGATSGVVGWVAELASLKGNETAGKVSAIAGGVGCATGDLYSCGVILTSSSRLSPPPRSKFYEFVVTVRDVEEGQFFQDENGGATMQSVSGEKVGEVYREVLVLQLDLEGDTSRIILDGLEHTVTGDGNLRQVALSDVSDITIIQEASNEVVTFSEYFTLTGAGTFDMETMEITIEYSDLSHLLWNLDNSVSVSTVTEVWTGKPLVAMQD